MVEEINLEQIVNIDRWVKENDENFKPPVCNAIMAGSFLKVMFVGGPNVRRDYHLDQGEELFYMMKGEMCLKIMLPDGPKDVVIREGEIFLLPSCIPHSPQRFPNTLGLVIERDRSNVYDGLRYYCDDGVTILWQKCFYLHSLVKDFPIVIKEFLESDEFKSGIPKPGTKDFFTFPNPKNTNFSEPIPLQEWLSKNLVNSPDSVADLYNSEEFQVKIYGTGTFNVFNMNETWLWLKVGTAVCTLEKKTMYLNENDSLLISANKSFILEIMGEKSFCMVFSNLSPNHNLLD